MESRFPEILLSAAAAILAENTVFSRGFGVSTMITAAKNKRSLMGTVLGVMWFTLWAGAAARLLSVYVSETDKLFMPLCYAAAVGLIYAVTLVLARLFTGRAFGHIKKYVHISAFNSAVMGTIFLSAGRCSSLQEYLMFGIFAGLGFAIAAVMLSGVYRQLCSENVPGAFRGFPAIMIYTGLMAMAVYGISGRTPGYRG